MEKANSSKKKYILVSIIPFALALFFIVYNSLNLISLNTTKVSIKNLTPDDVKSGVFVNGIANGEIALSCLEIKSKLKGDIVDYGNEYYYVVSYYENEEGYSTKYIPLRMGEKLQAEFQLYDDEMVIPENAAPIYIKGKIKKLDDDINTAILDMGKDLFGSANTEITKGFIGEYYIDTTVGYSSVIKLIFGGILAIITTLLLLYKIKEEKSKGKGKIFAYIAIPFLITFIVLVFLNSSVMFS